MTRTFEPRSVEPTHFKLWIRLACILGGRRFHYLAAGVVAIVALTSAFPAATIAEEGGLFSLLAIAYRFVLAIGVLLVYSSSVSAAIDGDGGNWWISFKHFFGSFTLITRLIRLFITMLMMIPLLIVIAVPEASATDPIQALYLHIGHTIGLVAVVYTWLCLMDHSIHDGDFLVVPLVGRLHLDYLQTSDLVDRAMALNPWLRSRSKMMLGSSIVQVVQFTLFMTVGGTWFWPVALPAYLGIFLYGPFCFAAYRDLFEHREVTDPETVKVGLARSVTAQ